MMTMITANTDFKLHTVVIQICVITVLMCMMNSKYEDISHTKNAPPYVELCQFSKTLAPVCFELI